ncbi:MAG TPA: zf-HC2 domain-containing protein [Streptosporangiaceae bacterium]|nr:zf-HC2 domain-containing protein [Streptosporangiaceae bacterium]
MRLRIRPDPHSLAGAYALDALDSPGERDRFERHLSRCPSGAAEVRGFRVVATAMAFAVTAEAPAGPRPQVLAAAARTRQLPPEVSSHAGPQRTRSTLPWLPWLSGAVALASVAGWVPASPAASTHPVRRKGPYPGQRQLLTWPPVTVAVAAGVRSSRQIV